MTADGGMLAGRAALVTGAGSGIGRASALAFAAAGARVAAADVNPDTAAETAALIGEAGGEAMALAADVADPDQVEDMVARTVAAFERLDCAHNNAGIPGPYQPLVDYSEQDFARVLSVNLLGVWRCIKVEARQMLRQGCGAIVSTSSVLGSVAMPDNSAYIAAKHGVEGLTRSAAVELAGAGIRVNAVAPGVIRTGMTSGVSDDLAAAAPMARFGQPAEVAAAAVWLCSDAAAFVTGAILPVDGGYLTR